ncbi:thiamine diphosphokinase [Clostridium oryzae]|uniref:Thiamine diphosphokinase n=1 Tax=Clostridium oryzae TaxID=1450648 RepID=A0A1V4IP00_9CLOT|nr:thiamine diphosphokinase [Clostridium oryzae]OPJ61762.1 thiamine pyrophosphokinase [Clostridium oryzae]
MKILIVAGGSKPSKELLVLEAENSDYIIGVDKGTEYIFECGQKPDLMVGDFDSINEEKLNDYRCLGIKILEYPPEKDYTDTKLAVVKSLELQVDAVVMLGCVGGRLDHTLSNVGLLYEYLQAGKEAYIKDDNNTIFMINKPTTFKGTAGNYFSLIPFGGAVEGLSIEGAKYGLDNYNLDISSSRTVSNEFTLSPVKIDFKSGILIVIFSKD